MTHITTRPISPTRRPEANTGTRDPARTRRNLLDAAYCEFAAYGFNGTTVERICRRARVSKQVLSHHFGSKEGAHLAVLEQAYMASRANDPYLADESHDPATAMQNFVALTFDHLNKNRAFVRLQADENVNCGRHIRKSAILPSFYDPLITRLAALLQRGEATGAFRAGLDARQVYISISALCYFTFSNAETLSAVFAADLLGEAALAVRRAHVIELLTAGLRPWPT